MSVDEAMEPFRRLDKDLKAAAKLMRVHEARWVVKMYYTIQDCRTRSANQTRDLLKRAEPNSFVAWNVDLFRLAEANIKRGLDVFTQEYTLSRWMRSLVGVGPVISAGILTAFDIRRSPYAGGFWRFAGQDPTREWLGKDKATTLVNTCFPELKLKGKLTFEQLTDFCNGQKIRWETVVKYLEGNTTPTKEQLIKYMSLCPYDQHLKALCHRMGDCFVKFKNHENDYYGKIYDMRKNYELEKNEKKEYMHLVEETLSSKKRKCPGKDTEAYKWYSQGMLPPGRIHLRALKYAVKMFLSHVHHVMYEDYYNKQPPLPFPLAQQGDKHTHFVPIPNYPLSSDLKAKSLRELLDDPT